MIRDDSMHDDSSHYEISLTAGQAFTAFVLMLLSLAASFAFGVIIGRGNAAPSAAGTAGATITEGVAMEAGDAPEVELPATGSERSAASAAVPVSVAERKPTSPRATVAEKEPVVTQAEPGDAVPYFAQILSTREGPAAEVLAAKLIDEGFRSAYVERVPSDGGLIYRVRVRFPSEGDARAAVSRLRSFAPGEIWVSHE